MYKPFEHQHLQEIKQSLNQLQADLDQEILFIPVRGDFARGIFASVYTDFEGNIDDAKALYANFYKGARFTFISEKSIDLKQVVNTNKCLLYLEKHGNKLLIFSVIDNLHEGCLRSSRP